MRTLALLLSLPLAATAAAAEPAVRAHVGAALDASAGKSADGRERLALRFGARRLSFVLAENTELAAAFDAPTRAAMKAASDRFLRGEIEGVPGSWVRLSRVAGRWTGAFHDGAELHLIDAAQVVGDQLAHAPAAPLVVYRLSDVVLPVGADQAGATLTYPELTGAAAVQPKAATKQMDLTIVVDTEFTAQHGANAASVAASRVNTVDGIYSNQVGVHLVLAHYQALGSNGTLTTTNPSALIDAFRTYTVSGAGSSIPKNDLRHLFSGKDFDGSTVGVAYLGVICNTNYGVGINQVRDASQVTALTVAHELGHNYGAPHDGEGACASASGGIMSPVLNGSSQFSSCSLQQMADDVANAACLAPYNGGGGPVPLIYANGFE